MLQTGGVGVVLIAQFSHAEDARAQHPSGNIKMLRVVETEVLALHI